MSFPKINQQKNKQTNKWWLAWILCNLQATILSLFFFLMTFCMMDFAEKKGLLIVYIITNTTIIIIIMVIIIIIIISHPCCPTWVTKQNTYMNFTLLPLKLRHPAVFQATDKEKVPQCVSLGCCQIVTSYVWVRLIAGRMMENKSFVL